MQTRTALRRLGGAQHHLAEGPLSDIATQLVEAMTDREASRLEDAHRRAEQLGSGPHLQALQRLAREYSAQTLRDNSAPAIMRADLHEILKTASAQVGKGDRGLARAKVHAYRLWSQDPSGVLTVGDVARLRDYYKGEHPRSKIAEVIDTQVPKVGFNTLPVARLTRIAADIARHAEAEGTDVQTVYETAIRTQGFDRNTPESIRARAFIRGLLDEVAEPEAAPLDITERTMARMATATDPLLSRVGQVMDPDLDVDSDGIMDADEEPGMGDTEYAEITSPITGEPMMLELETAEQAEEEGELGESAVDVMPGDIDRLEVMGQLEDLSVDSIETERGDIPMGPESDESVAVIQDPTDPEGGELEVTVRAIEEEPEPDFEETPEEPGDLDMEVEADSRYMTRDDYERERERYHGTPTSGPSEDELARQERQKRDRERPQPGEEMPQSWMTAAKTFSVYAYTAGTRASEPIDRFEAKGMADALRRIADHGVRGEVRSTGAAFADEALIVLNKDRGEYLQVTAEVSGETDSKFKPKINEQQPAYMPSVPDDGGAALKSDSMGKQRKPKKHAQVLAKPEVMKRCASLELTPETIEHRLLEGETVKAAGWSLRATDDADLELCFEGGHARTAALSHMDDVIANFMMHVAQDVDLTPKKEASYDVTELFAVRCASCGGIGEYLMPAEPADVDCGECGFTTTAQVIAQSFAAGDPSTGYVLVTDVPGGDDVRDRQINAKRILASIQHVLPTARGVLRRDAKLEVMLDGADGSSLQRVRRVLEDRYSVKAFSIDAQAVPNPAMDAEGDPQTQQSGPNYVGPPQQPTVQPVVPATPQVAPVQTGAPAQQELMQQHQASYLVHYATASGETGTAPVDAVDAETARRVFARFNSEDVEITKIEAQLAPPPPMAAPEPMPGDPIGGAESAELPLEPQLEMEEEEEELITGAHGLRGEEADAVRAALTHYRNQGLGPMSALDQLNSQYRELIDRYGEKTDVQRHLIEAEAMKIAAEVWMKPAVMEVEAVKKSGGDLPMPSSINTQQPDAVSAPKDLGKDSDSDDSVTNSLEAPKINTQVKPQGTFSNTSTEPDSDNRDPGDFGAGKPKAQHPATDQQGVSLSDTNLGKDSDTGDNKATKSWDSVSSGASNNIRSK